MQLLLLLILLQILPAQSTGVVEYTDCIFAEGSNLHIYQEFPVSDTKLSDGKSWSFGLV